MVLISGNMTHDIGKINPVPAWNPRYLVHNTDGSSEDQLNVALSDSVAFGTDSNTI